MTTKKDLENWVSDRLENQEPLMLNEFYKFMRDLGYSTKELQFLKDKKIRKKITEKYRKDMKELRKERYLWD